MSFHIAFTSVSAFTLILSPTAFFSSPIIQPSNTLSFGAVKPFFGNSYSLPFFTSCSAILPVPLLPLKLTLYSISFQMAFTSVSAFTLILSPTAFFSSPIIQPSNTLSFGAVKPFFGNSYSLPFFTSCSAILPVPLLPLKLTLYSMSFQTAFTSASAFTLILSPTAFFSLPTIQPSNFLPSGAVKPFSGNSYSLPFFTSCSAILPVPLLPLKLTLYSMSFQIAFTSVSAFIVILSLAAFFSVPIIHPSNSFPSGAIKPFAGNVYSLPFLTI